MTVWAAGCSHTAGTGLNTDQRWTDQLADLLGEPVTNLAQAGAGHEDVRDQLLAADPLGTVIVQWPNPFRRRLWHGTRARTENVHAGSDLFHTMLRASEQNFVAPWLDSVRITHAWLEARGCRPRHIVIETLLPQQLTALAQWNITVHQDSKTPEATWLMDSGAADGLHHSALCHRQWAERIKRLLNEHTTP